MKIFVRVIGLARSGVINKMYISVLAMLRCEYRLFTSWLLLGTCQKLELNCFSCSVYRACLHNKSTLSLKVYLSVFPGLNIGIIGIISRLFTLNTRKSYRILNLAYQTPLD